MTEKWRRPVTGVPERPTSPIGLAFVLFVLGVLLMFGLSTLEVRSGLVTPDGLASQFGVVASTIFGVAAMIVAHRVIRLRQLRLLIVAAVLFSAGSVWSWLVFVQGRLHPLAIDLVTVAAALVAIALLLQGLRLAHWLEVFSGLGLVAVVLVAAVVRTSPVDAAHSAFTALLAVTGGMACLYGALVDVEIAEQRSMNELVDSKRHIESEMSKAEEILHDLRTGLLAIEAAIGSFDGELAAPLRAEAARLRRLTVRGQRTIGPFDLVAKVGDLVSTRQAGGTPVRLSAPPTAEVWGEQSEVLAIVDNLLSNAERHGESTPITVEITEGSGATTLLVSNGGPGLPADGGQQLFQRGVSTHPDGDGVGLSRARLLAALNGAHLDWRPTDDGRTTIALDLRSEPPLPVG